MFTSLFATLGTKLTAASAVLVVVLGLVTYGAVEHSHAVTYKAEAAQLVETNKETLAALAHYQAQQARNNAAVAVEAAKARAASATLAKVEAGIGGAQDGPVAPVISQTLSALRGQ